MANIARHGASAGEYSIIYSNMRGVDLRGDGSTVAKYRFAELENMYKDYDSGSLGSIESVPGYRRLIDLEDELYGLFSFKDSSGFDTVAAHAGDKLYSFPLSAVKRKVEPYVYTGLARHKSAAYSARGSLFILDGEKIVRLNASGAVPILTDLDGIYVPTTFVSGVEYEQRNLLTRKFKERTTVGSAASCSFGTEGIKYAVTDPEKRECAVAGIDGGAEEVYIPSRVTIGNHEYEVKAISDYAFRNNTSIKKLFIAGGTSHVGFLAFDGCTALEKVILADTVVSIAEGAFGGCISLVELWLGSALASVGTLAFNLCSRLESVKYPKSSSELSKVAGVSNIPIEVTCNAHSTECRIKIDLHSPAENILSVEIDGVKNDTYTTLTDGSGAPTGIALSFDSPSDIEGKQVVITALYPTRPECYTGLHAGFLSSSYNGDGNVYSIIGGCTVAESYDGRIFLTGNPKYPGYTFYSSIGEGGENDPLYFGDLSYFLDGLGGFGNVALLATSDSLAVFKEPGDSGGTIYYHTPHDTGIDILPRIYPTSSIHTGFSAIGGAISFYDDPIFISRKGVSALSKRSVNLERSIITRSSNVNPRLLSEDLSTASLAVWRGYLCVSVGGNIDLADSRQTFGGEGGTEYEWYILTGIGSYRGDERVYRYSPFGENGLSVHKNTDGRVDATVLSSSADGKTLYYTEEDGVRYAVYPTEEMMGGEFSAARYLVSVSDRLIFGTGTGVISIFNDDMRGELPPGREGDEPIPKGSLHPYFYSFDRHAPRYAVMSARDNCGMPHLAKDTVKHSLTMKLRAIGKGSFRCEVFSDGKGYLELCRFPSGDLGFSGLDFSNMTLQTEEVYTVPLAERAKRWVEKQIALYTDEYESPFGIYSIAYRFKVRGKIKKNR